MAWGQTTKEPLIGESLDDYSSGALLKDDIGVRGVWQTQEMALFDVSQLLKMPRRKRSLNACEEKHVSFTPLCLSVDGLIGNEAKTYLKRLAEHLSENWQEPYSTICTGLILNFVLIRATDILRV